MVVKEKKPQISQIAQMGKEVLKEGKPQIDKIVCLDIEGVLYAFTLPMLSRSDLKELKALLLKKIHALCVTREMLYDQLAEVNGELDRRTNEKACCVQLKVEMG